MQEAKGFKGDIGKDEGAEQGSEAGRQVPEGEEAHETRTRSLRTTGALEGAFESKDIRTPDTYFQNRQELEERLSTIKTKLNDLQSHPSP